MLVLRRFLHIRQDKIEETHGVKEGYLHSSSLYWRKSLWLFYQDADADAITPGLFMNVLDSTHMLTYADKHRVFNRVRKDLDSQVAILINMLECWHFNLMENAPDNRLTMYVLKKLILQFHIPDFSETSKLFLV